MIIQCESCSKKFIVKDSDIPKEGRNVQCGYCSFTWHQKLTSAADKPIKLTKIAKSSKKVDEAEQFAIKADPLSKQIEEADEFDIEADPLSNQVEEADEGIENEYLNSESTYTSLGHITISRPSLVPNSNTCGIKLQSFKDVKEKIKDMYIKHPFEFECKICGKICSKISNIKEHIEIHIEGLRFPCRTCGSEYGSRSGRRVHERVFHKMKPKIKNSFN